MDYQSLQIIGSRTSGGAERFYCRLVAGLHAVKHGVLAINPPGSAVAREIGAGPAQTHVKMRSVWDPLARFQLSRLVKRLRPAVVQTYMGRATRLMKMPQRGGPVHVARLGGFYDVRHYQHVDYLIGNTQGICDYLVREGVPHERVFHMPNCVDVASPRPDGERDTLCLELGIDPQDWLVVFAGRLHPNKGLSDLLTALAKLPEAIAGRRLQLIALGDGELRESLQAETAASGLDARVHWLGWVSDPDPWYGAADLFVCSSVHEPLGNVVLEAWAHGTPVIATRTDGPVEVCEPDTDAVLVPPSDPESLAGAIRTLLEADADTRSALGLAGKHKLAQTYSTDRIVSDYVSLYERLVDARTG